MVRLFVAACAVAVIAAACATGTSPATGAPAAPTEAMTEAPITTATPGPGPAGSPSPTVASGTVTIEMSEDFFTPQVIEVAVGTTVVWRNVGEEDHDVHAKDGSFSSSMLGPGASFSYTFTKSGTYPYFCAPHVGDGMVGEVDVR